MRKTVISVSAVFIVALAAQANIVTIYDTWAGQPDGGPNGDGSPFSNPVGSFYSPDVNFGTGGWGPTDAWTPFGRQEFGATVTGGLHVDVSGLYHLILTSDDGSSLTVNGTKVISNPGYHAPGSVAGDVYLNAGCNPFLINYWEETNPQSILKLELPQGVTYCTPDAGSTLALLGGAFVMLGALGRRFRK